MWRLISEKLWLIAKDVVAQIKSRGRSLGLSGDSLIEMRWLIAGASGSSSGFES